jgi:4'-phosphopantetheinyl transferase
VTVYYNAFGHRSEFGACWASKPVERWHREAAAAGKMDLIIKPTSAEIHVWLTFCEAISDERLLVAYRELLNATEKQEESRFYSARDRHSYLVTRALVRTVLSRYASVDPKDWVFSTNAYGRPYIVNPQATDGCLSFNVSQTQGLIVLGVAKGRSLGVDVENFNTRDISIDIANHYFAPEEVAALHEVSYYQQRYRFFEYWTLKESYIKARGMGFSLPLDRFSFHFADDHVIDLVINPELGDDSSRWQLWQFRPSSEHLLAICAEKLNAQSPRLLVRETTPGVSERILASEPVRTSEMEH